MIPLLDEPLFSLELYDVEALEDATVSYAGGASAGVGSSGSCFSRIIPGRIG